MRTPTRSILFCLFVFLISAISPLLRAQSNAGSINGIITDPSGAVVPGATVSIENPVSQYARSTTTDSAGHYSFPNLPFNPYHLDCQGEGLCFLRAGCRCPFHGAGGYEHRPQVGN